MVNLRRTNCRVLSHDLVCIIRLCYKFKNGVLWLHIPSSYQNSTDYVEKKVRGLRVSTLESPLPEVAYFFLGPLSMSQVGEKHPPGSLTNWFVNYTVLPWVSWICDKSSHVKLLSYYSGPATRVSMIHPLEEAGLIHVHPLPVPFDRCLAEQNFTENSRFSKCPPFFMRRFESFGASKVVKSSSPIWHTIGVGIGIRVP